MRVVYGMNTHVDAVESLRQLRRTTQTELVDQIRSCSDAKLRLSAESAVFLGIWMIDGPNESQIPVAMYESASMPEAVGVWRRDGRWIVTHLKKSSMLEGRLVETKIGRT